MSSFSPPPPRLLRAGLPLGAVLAIACTAAFMVVMDSAIVNVALPSIRAALHLSAAAEQWVVDAYLLALGGCILLAARAGDLFGRRATLLCGLVLFTAASAVGGLADSGPVLLGARVVQGVGASGLATSTLSVIMAATQDDGAARRRALSVWAAASSSAAALGILIGGVLTQQAGWRWVMFVNVPVGLALIGAVGYCLLPSQARPDRQALDVPGALTAVLGIGALLYAVSQAGQVGWAAPRTLQELAAAAALLAAFLLIEARSRSPLVRLDLFRTANIRTGNLLVLMLGAALTASLYLASQVLQQVLGYDARQTGLAMLPMGVCLAGAALGSRRLLATGTRRLPCYGGLVGGAGLLWLSRVPLGAHYLPDLLGPLLLTGTGLGLMLMSATSAATAGVPARDTGLASGLLNMNRQLGGALGIAVLSTLNESVTRGSLAGHPLRVAQLNGYHAALAAAAGFSALAGLVSLLLRPTDTPRSSA
ncbi:MFS transporter [Streptacidiphilus albus]|uniref:MFS transporter n=1 Tax=Streptacidiphilus albus TaxID=105425 RepID=UPI0005A9CA07|nr:MFS transporter [Streptacidiphilus albus]